MMDERAMAGPISDEELMRYLDGELSADEKTRIEAALSRSTELQRDLMVFRSMKEELLGLSFQVRPNGRSAWDVVHRKLTRPVGWIALAAGSLLWVVYGVWVYFTHPGELIEKAATGALGIGVLLLLGSVIWEQYQRWLTDPYRDVVR
jgi:hypothetical protein